MVSQPNNSLDWASINLLKCLVFDEVSRYKKCRLEENYRSSMYYYRAAQ